jgi:hypothetical protein
MYIVINNTTGDVYSHKDNFPNLDDKLNMGHDIIIVSTYSNSVKRPTSDIINGITEWYWIDYSYLP